MRHLLQLIFVLSLIDFPIYEQRYGQEIKPVLQYVQQHRKDSERIYIYYWAEPAFRYYAHDYGFNYSHCHLITPIPKNEWIKEVDYFRLKQNAQPIAVEKTRCVLGVSELYEQSRIDITQLSHQGKNVWFIKFVMKKVLLINGY